MDGLTNLPGFGEHRDLPPAPTDIEGLRAENERLRFFHALADNHHNALKCPYCNPNWDTLEKIIVAQTAEIVRLTAALEEIATHPHTDGITRIKAREAMARGGEEVPHA